MQKSHRRCTKNGRLINYSWGESNEKIASEIKNHVLTGISYMIPLVIAGAVIMAISRVGGSFYGIVDIWDGSHGESANAIIRLLHSLDGFGGTALV